MTPSVQAALNDARQTLSALYGDRLVRVVLYGSQARGEAGPESDVDILVTLRDPFDLYGETKRLAALQTDLLDRYDEFVVLQPYTEAEYQSQAYGFIQNVRADGIEL